MASRASSPTGKPPRRPAAAQDALAACLWPAPSPRIRLMLSDPRFDWPTFLHAANRYLLTPALPWRLHGHGAWDVVPEPVREYLEATSTLSECKAADMLDQLERVVRILNGVGIVPMALKSIAGAIDGVYPSPGCRIMSDLDLLIGEAEWERSVAALRAAGYCPSPSQYERWTAAAPARVRHYPRLFHEDERAGVELHRSLLGDLRPGTLEAGPILARGQAVTWRGVTLTLPAMPDRLLHHIVHAVELPDEWLFRGKASVRRLVDFTLLCARAAPSDLDALAAEIRRCHLWTPVDFFLGFAQCWTGVTFPSQLSGTPARRLRQRIARAYARMSMRPGPFVLLRAGAALYDAVHAPDRARFVRPASYVRALRRLGGEWTRLRGARESVTRTEAPR